MDDLDSRILLSLDRNARAPWSEIAQQLKVSKQAFQYRLTRMSREKVILGYRTLVDIHHLGLMSFRIYFRFRNLSRDREQEIVSYFCKSPNTLWVGTTEGIWDLEVVFAVRNFVHLNNIFKKLQSDLGRFFQRYNISMSPVCYRFPRDYLVNPMRKAPTTSYYGFEPQRDKLDRNDFRILRHLALDARSTIKDLANRLGLAFQTVRVRIAKLEELKIIQGYNLLLNLKAIGRRYYKALVKLEAISPSIEKAIYDFCGQHSFVTYLTEVFGDWQLEIECENVSVDELNLLLKELRRKFPDNIVDYDILGVLKEAKLNYFPVSEEDFSTLIAQ